MHTGMHTGMRLQRATLDKQCAFSRASLCTCSCARPPFTLQLLVDLNAADSSSRVGSNHIKHAHIEPPAVKLSTILGTEDFDEIGTEAGEFMPVPHYLCDLLEELGRPLHRLAIFGLPPPQVVACGKLAWEQRRSDVCTATRATTRKETPQHMVTWGHTIT